MSSQDCQYGELSIGYCNRGAAKKRFKDSLKKTVGTCHIDHHYWSTLAADFQACRLTVHQFVSPLRTPAGSTSGRNATGGKIQGASAALQDQTFNCRRCDRTCLSRIGLVSHQSTWTTYFINLRSRSLIKNMLLFVLNIIRKKSIRILD